MSSSNDLAYVMKIMIRYIEIYYNTQMHSLVKIKFVYKVERSI